MPAKTTPKPPPKKKTPRARPKFKKPSFTQKPRNLLASLARRTITINRETEESVLALVGPRKFSAFTQMALDHAIQRKRIDQWLDEQETEHGPLSAEDLAFAEIAWQKRK